MKKKHIYLLIIFFIALIVILKILTHTSEFKRSASLVVEKSKEEKMSDKQQPKYVEGEALVKFKEDIDDESARRIISEYNCKVIEKIEAINVYKIALPEGKSVEEMVKLFNKDPRVKYAEPNYLFTLQ